MTSALKTLATALCAATLLGGCGAAPSAQTRAETTDRIIKAYNGPKLRVAVGDFKTMEAVTDLLEQMEWKGIAPLISEQVVTGLTQTERVVVLERSQLDKVIGNMELEKTDKAEYFDQATTAEKGRFLGAQVVFVGAITEFEPNVSGSDSGLQIKDTASVKTHSDRAVVGVDVRLVNQQTGRVMYAATAQGVVTTAKFEGKLDYADVKMGSTAWSRTPLGVATREAADKAIAKLIEAMKVIPWEAPVAGGSGDKVFIAAGEDSNVRKGDRFKFISRGDPITDMEGNPIGFDETEIGWVEVQLVQPKMSVARIVERSKDGVEPKKGDVVRLPLEN